MRVALLSMLAATLLPFLSEIVGYWVLFAAWIATIAALVSLRAPDSPAADVALFLFVFLVVMGLAGAQLVLSIPKIGQFTLVAEESARRSLMALGLLAPLIAASVFVLLRPGIGRAAVVVGLVVIAVGLVATPLGLARGGPSGILTFAGAMFAAGGITARAWSDAPAPHERPVSS